MSASIHQLKQVTSLAQELKDPLCERSYKVTLQDHEYRERKKLCGCIL